MSKQASSESDLKKQRDHANKIATEACLAVMNSDGILGILIDREVLSKDRVLALTADDVAELYDWFVGPAVDDIEDYLLSENP